MFPGSVFPHAVFPSLDFPDLSSIVPTPGWPFPYVVFPDAIFPTRDFPNGAGILPVPTVPLDYIAAIVAFWYSDPTLLAAFPGIDGAGSRGLLVGESDESVPMPRCVLNYVGGRRSGSTGRPYLVWHTIQFSIFAGDYETSRNDAYLVHDKYHKLILAFQNGIMKSAALEEPFLAPNTVLPSFGATTAFDHVVEGRYLIQRNVGPYPP